MAENKAPRNNAHCTLPDDPEQSTYRFIIVSAKRARQLQDGARPVLPTSSKKPTIIAMEEVRRGGPADAAGGVPGAGDRTVAAAGIVIPDSTIAPESYQSPISRRGPGR